jgi:hypothetical protein
MSISLCRDTGKHHPPHLTAKDMQAPDSSGILVNDAIGPSSSSRTTGPCTRSLFEFCRTAHPDGPFTPAREGSKDVFPRAAFVPHLEQLYILFFCPWNLALLWLQRCLMYLGMCRGGGFEIAVDLVSNSSIYKCRSIA